MRKLLFSFFIAGLSTCYVKSNGLIGLDWNGTKKSDSLFYQRVNRCTLINQKVAKEKGVYTDEISSFILHKCIHNSEYKFTF